MQLKIMMNLLKASYEIRWAAGVVLGIQEIKSNTKFTSHNA